MIIDNAVQKIRSFYSKNKRLPSYQEMCILFEFSSKKASFDLAKKLIDAGFLKKDDTGRLIPHNLFPRLRVIGSIQAGTPTPAEEQLMETMSFDHFLVNQPERSYLLRVSGESMIDAGIHPGDLVVIEETHTPKEGDIVVANVDGEFTLKYFHRTNSDISLLPANKSFNPIHARESLEIVGIVVSVIRKYH